MYLKDGWVLKVGSHYIYSLNYNNLEHVSLDLCKDIEEATVFIDKEIEGVNDMLFSLSIYAKPIEIEMHGALKREITEEQKYYICLPNMSGENEVYIWYEEETGNYYTTSNKTIGEVAGNKIQFTEQEIKDYEPRYMAFAKPVEE